MLEDDVLAMLEIQYLAFEQLFYELNRLPAREELVELIAQWTKEGASVPYLVN